jgi:hypothetical protein
VSVETIEHPQKQRRQRRQSNRRVRAGFAWGLVFFVSAQIAVNILLDYTFPEVYDPEFYTRLGALKARMAERPDSPILVLVGSSRTVISFLPEKLPTLRTRRGQEVIPFNFSHLGAGPAMNLVVIRRLLQEGIKPDWLILEVMPPQLADPTQNIIADTATARDLQAVARCKGIWLTLARYARARLVPCSKHRSFLLRRFIPGWIPSPLAPLDEQVHVGPRGGDDSWFLLRARSTAEIHKCMDWARAVYLPALQSFHLCKMSDRAVRESLSLCRRKHITVALIVTPEATEFQSWYPPGVRAEIDRYCEDLSTEYHIPVIDARNWLPDGDFFDGHHVLLPGARVFTDRLGQEVLQPWLSGQLQPAGETQSPEGI